MTHSFLALRLATDQRIERFPNNPFFMFADRELKKIERHWRSFGSFNRAFYDDLDIGLMCVRELEQIDPEFCTTVYELLEDIRTNIV